MSLPLLITRPRARCEDFAAALAEALPGRFAVTASPLVEIVSEEAFLGIDGAQALLFSSATAVAEFARHSDARHLPALCVGDKTAATAQALGFSTQTGSGDAAALAELAAISYLDGGGHFLYPRGRQAAGDVAGSLMAQGIPVEEVILYNQRPEALSPQARALLAQPQALIVPLFSANAARRLAEELAEPGLERQAPLAIVAISGNVAAACANIPGAQTYVAPQPSGTGILQVLASF